MKEIAVNVAVLQGNRILLTQREDVETWILPGGGVEERESITQAAIRETREETGLDIELTRLVGIYSRLGDILKGHVVLFTGKAIGGEIRCQPGETIAVAWFPLNQIPDPLSLGHRRRIEDAISGIGGSLCVTQEFHLPGFPNLDQQELYELRDRSGLTRQRFYMQLIEGASYREIVDFMDG